MNGIVFRSVEKIFIFSPLLFSLQFCCRSYMTITRCRALWQKAGILTLNPKSERAFLCVRMICVL